MASFLSTFACPHKTWYTSMHRCVKSGHEQNLRFVWLSILSMLLWRNFFINVAPLNVFFAIAYVQGSCTSSHPLNANFEGFYNACIIFRWTIPLLSLVLLLSIFGRWASVRVRLCDCSPTVSMLGGALKVIRSTRKCTVTPIIWYDLIFKKHLR
jgi:hypothetical protein